MTADSYNDEQLPVRPGLLRALLGAALLAVVGFGGWSVLNMTGAQAVAQLRVEGALYRVQPQQVVDATRQLLESRFVDVSLERVQDAVARLPWVSRVRVERIWPDTVRVHIWEREPIARWGEGDLLDSSDQVFPPGDVDVDEALPQLAGPAGSAAEVIAMFRRLQTGLSETPFSLSGLRRDARGDWVGVTTDDVELRFGRDDPARSLELLRGAVAVALAPRLSEVAHVDLRYTNGFSVGWREPAQAGERN